MELVQQNATLKPYVGYVGHHPTGLILYGLKYSCLITN
nr:MAG TPA: hypothetical protein [Caudoviricetes sp.]